MMASDSVSIRIEAPEGQMSTDVLSALTASRLSHTQPRRNENLGMTSPESHRVPFVDVSTLDPLL